jgi:hypothetical protein
MKNPRMGAGEVDTAIMQRIIQDIPTSTTIRVNYHLSYQHRLNTMGHQALRAHPHLHLYIGATTQALPYQLVQMRSMNFLRLTLFQIPPLNYSNKMSIVIQCLRTVAAILIRHIVPPGAKRQKARILIIMVTRMLCHATILTIINIMNPIDLCSLRLKKSLLRLRCPIHHHYIEMASRRYLSAMSEDMIGSRQQHP